MERVLLIGVFETEKASRGDDVRFEMSMKELDALVSACEMKPVGMSVQQMPLANKATYVGAGKLSEIQARLQELSADGIVANDTLTPTQLRNLSKELKVEVMDRTALILEIFKKRARSREARLQVELAHLQYIKPRLIGMWEKQNRQGGGSGATSAKGEGETQLELDRRQIDHRLVELRKNLKVVEQERQTQRKKRQRSRLPLVSLIGYTNVGKSAIMNGMLRRFGMKTGSEKDVFEENMLFATLDTSIRKIETGDNRDFMLSDTVGFVNKLPTGLIEAFKSTLEELTEADLLLHVIDVSDPEYHDRMAVTEDMIKELGAGDIPVIYVYNKADAAYPPVEYPRVVSERADGSGKPAKSIYICAREESSIEALSLLIADTVYGDYREVTMQIPFDKGAVASYLQQNAVVLSTEYNETGTRITARCHRADIEKYHMYVIPKGRS